MPLPEPTEPTGPRADAARPGAVVGSGVDGGVGGEFDGEVESRVGGADGGAGRPGRHRSAQPGSAGPAGSETRARAGEPSDAVGEVSDPPGARSATPGEGSGAGPRVAPPRVAALRAVLADRVPPWTVPVRVGLGRSWWLPVLVGVGLLALAVGSWRFGLAGGPARVDTAAAVPRTAAASTAAVATTAPSGPPGVVPASGDGAPPGTTPPSATSPPAGSTAPPGSTAPTAAASGAGDAPGAEVVVDVVGRVVHAGVVRLPSGARVGDALAAAGGALRGVDTSPLNLAQPVADGQQIRVGLPGGWLVDPGGPAASSADTGGGAAGGTPGRTTPTGSAASPGAAGLVDLNTATVEQLDGLPGVGPSTAQKILDWRTAHGRFGSVDDLDEVSGIGPAKLAELRPLVRV